MKKIIIMLFCVFLFSCFVCITSTSVDASDKIYYKTSSIATDKDIEITDSILNKAKSSATKKTDSFVAYSTISKEYETHIYHFEAPTSGYYAFYTSGDTDTVMKIYEHQNFLWWTTRYDDLGLSYNGSLASSSKNASMIIKCDKGEDYYICVRASSKNTGSYILHVGPNEDYMSLYFYNYSKWTCVDTQTSLTYYSYPLEKIYLSKQEVVLYYWALSSNNATVKDSNGKTYSVNDICCAYKENVAKGISIANTILGILCPSEYSLAQTVVGLLVEIIWDKNCKSPSEMVEILEETCNAKRIDQSITYYSNGDIVTISKWTASTGLCITKQLNKVYINNAYMSYISTYYNSYSSNQFTIRKGSKYDKGKWSNK